MEQKVNITFSVEYNSKTYAFSVYPGDTFADLHQVLQMLKDGLISYEQSLLNPQPASPSASAAPASPDAAPAAQGE